MREASEVLEVDMAWKMERKCVFFDEGKGKLNSDRHLREHRREYE